MNDAGNTCTVERCPCVIAPCWQPTTRTVQLCAGYKQQPPVNTAQQSVDARMCERAHQGCENTPSFKIQTV
eukprot:333596-Pelagomonas_calceolata.AAC.1